ncbi:hypothetical protein HYFRA_00000591 [Hymenoscyphus fraxineus]|uniref:Tyrosine specific protein phosphatases domain-containing protein n=1 Tax=Hymenoscyphus fraxineus TaxID=746836 RepID=A0A9N9PY21_9HELO|nr:hypothetical protein HYFRA_00000591 [Hymenoscyphus fraxineus]
MSITEEDSASKLDVLNDVLVVGEVLDEPFDNLLNFRDVGKTVNKFLGEKYVISIEQVRLISIAKTVIDVLQKAFFTDRQDQMMPHYKIEKDYKTTMALKPSWISAPTEHKKQKAKRESDLQSEELIEANPALAEPMQIPGLDYLPVNINGKGFEHNLLWQLSCWSFLKLIFLMMIGQRMKAISILGREVMEPRGLIGLGYDTLDFCGPEIADALRALSNPKTSPVLIHCTQGKDRTGIIIALALFLLKIPVEAVSHDYLLSVEGLVSERESRLVEIREIGLGEEFAGCPTGWVEAMKKHVDEKYEGIQGYVRSIGFKQLDENAFVETFGA